MSNDGWEDVTPSDGWEDITPSGTIKQTAKNALGGIDAALTMGAQVIPYIGSGLAGAAALPFVGIDKAEGFRKDLLESGLGLGEVKPVTKEGGEVMEMINHGFESLNSKAREGASKFKNPYTGADAGNEAQLFSDMVLGGWESFMPLPGGKAVRALGKQVEKALPKKKPAAPPTPAESVIQEELKTPELSPEEQKLKDQLDKRRPKQMRPDPIEAMARDLNPDYYKGEGPNGSPVIGGMAERLRNYQETTPEIRRADDSIAGRQMELQDPVQLEAAQRALELKRREHFEQEAAFRKQADAAPVLPNHGLESTMESPGSMPENMPLGERPGMPEREPPIARSNETVYVDPQGQAFRGDPADAMAKLALERQTEAMDRELTHLQGKGTPEGEPLRPLQDVERQVSMIDRAIADLKEQLAPMADLPPKGLKDTPISSKGKRSRQRGAIATGEIVKGLEEMLRTALKAAVDGFNKINIHPNGTRNAVLDVIHDPTNASADIANYLKTWGYPDHVVSQFRNVEETVRKLEEAKNSNNVHPDVRKTYTLIRNALEKIHKEADAIAAELDKIVSTELEPKEFYDALSKLSRGDKRRWTNLGKKWVELEDKERALNLTLDQTANFTTDDFIGGDVAEFHVRQAMEDNPNLLAQVQEILGKDTDKVKPADNVIKFVPRKERGSVDLGVGELIDSAIKKLREMRNKMDQTPSVTGVNASVIPPELRKPTTPPTPEQIAQKKVQMKLADHGPLRKALSEFDVIESKEEALALAKDAKDISSDYGQKNLGSGINFHAAMSDNPILKYARTLIRNARTYADNFSQTYLSNPKVGLTPVWSKMKGKERVAVMDALMAGDKHQVRVTESMMNKLGFNEHQRQFVETFYKANERMYNDWKAELETLGLKVPEYREGHFPGLFSGAYHTLVMDGKKVVGVISTDTVAQAKVATKYIKEQMGNKVTFLEQKRRGIAGSANRYYSDLFSGTQDVLKLLAEKDPNFADVKEIIDDAVKQSGNKLYNFNVHELHKKGVFGNEGNRPWLSPERNANDAFKALVRYFEEGTMHHATQVPHKLLADVAASPEVKHMPNAVKLMNDYVNMMMGRELSELGSAVNTILDQPFKYLVPTVSWGKEGARNISAGFGVGSHVPLKISGELKNTMSQMFMGWGNYMFTGAQMLQPIQTGVPFMQFAATRLGLNPAHVATSMGAGGTQFFRAVLEHQFGVDAGVKPHFREAFNYARERGMLTFSELERAYQGTQSKLGRMKDQAAEANMKFGEWSTRTPMFMAFVDLMHKAGMETKNALPIAENLTQFAMIDYHQWERPMVYQKLGVTGSFAAGLTTFKHGIISQQAFLAKQAVKPAGGHSRQVVPVAASMTTMLALAGITGSPFYDELDTLVKYLTNKFGGKQQSIRDIALANLPEWVNSGLISNATGLNMQGKFSSADMVPDSMMRAISPHLDAAGRILDSAYEMIKNRDAQGVRNFVTNAVPSGWKRAAEAAVSKDKEGYLIGKDGLPTVYRTPEEWDKAAVTGLRPQDEAISRDKLWNQRQRYQSDVDRMKEISKEYKRRIVNDNMPQETRKKLIDEYRTRGGDPKELLDLETSARIERKLPEKSRLEGIPKTLRSIHRFQNYNE